MGIAGGGEGTHPNCKCASLVEVLLSVDIVGVSRR